MIDLALTDAVELDLVGGDLSVTTDSAQVAQHLRTRLHLYYGEWVFNPESGIKYVEEIFIKAPDLNIVDGLLKSAILDTPGVVEITNYESALDDTTRALTVNFSYLDVYNVVTTISEELS
jgi:hypothetical protein